MHRFSSLSIVLRAVLFTGLSLTAFSQTNVLTYKNNNARTGANTTETILTHGNVNSNQFGKLWLFPTDGTVDAQPLYVSGLAITGQGTHNALHLSPPKTTQFTLSMRLPAQSSGRYLSCRRVRLLPITAVARKFPR